MLATATFRASDRAACRALLELHHRTAKEIWLLLDGRADEPTVSCLDAVQEAICFGWIDSIQKRVSCYERAQRFAPRKARSGWTELSTERTQRLIRPGLMTDAGRATPPDLSAPFGAADDILEALKTEPQAWSNYVAFPGLYRRVRIGYVGEVRKNSHEFERRLRNQKKEC